MLSKKVVFTNGCFDLMHRGHNTYLLEAAELGNRLIVDEVIDALNRASAQTGADWEGVQLHLLEHETLPVEVDKFLRWEYEQAIELDRASSQEELYEATASGKFKDALFWWLEAQYNLAFSSPSEGREIKLKIELAPFDSWVKLAAFTIVQEKIENTYTNGELELILNLIPKLTGFMRESAELRDRYFANDVSKYQISADAKEMMIIIRGSFHGPALAAALSDRGIEFEASTFGTNCSSNIVKLMQANEGEFDTDKLFRIIIEEDLDPK